MGHDIAQQCEFLGRGNNRERWERVKQREADNYYTTWSKILSTSTAPQSGISLGKN
jgi:hypothetical protein